MVTALDDWQLTHVIGSGGLAEVWHAQPTKGGPPVAIKILREAKQSQAHRGRFVREGLLLRRLSHPGLVRCHHVNSEHTPYLVLDLLEGQNLSEHIHDSGPLSVRQVFQMANALLNTLTYLHEQGVTHRDIKASNIHISNTGKVVLLDLGLATDPTHPLITTLGDVMGTYAYMAPEQIIGGQVDHRCDLYSLGVTLYEALAGQRPYEVLKQDRCIPDTPPTPLSTLRADIPVRLLDLISRLMARDPMDRPISAEMARGLLTTGEDHRGLRAPMLVGRAAALGAIEAALDASCTIVIHGEVASGTSRMANAALSLARQQGMETLAIRLRPGAHPLALLQQMLQDLRSIVDVVENTPEVLGRALGELAAESGALLLIEGIDHTSTETLAMLLHVLRIAKPISCVMTATQPPPNVPGHHVALRPLSRTESQQLIHQMLDTHVPPAGLVEQLHSISGGLPGVLVEGLREMETRGVLQCTGINDDGSRSWLLHETASFEPTVSLARLFGNALASLSTPARQVLEYLAIAGEALPLPMALRLVEASPDGLLLAPLLRHRLIERYVQNGDEWLELRRPAISVLLLRALSQHARQTMHRRLASALTELPPSEWREPLIAWHGALGAPPEQVGEAMVNLGDDLLRRRQPIRAIEILQSMSPLPPENIALHARRLCILGEAMWEAGRHTQAQDVCLQARALLEKQPAGKLHGRVLTILALIAQHHRQQQQAMERAEAAIQTFSGHTADVYLLRSLMLLAGHHRRHADRDRASALYNQCIDLAVDQDRRLYAAMAHGGLGKLLMADGQYPQAILHLEQEAAHARLHHLPIRLVATLCQLASCHQRMGRFDLALEAIVEAEQTAHHAQDPLAKARTNIARADLHLAIHDLDMASELLSEARTALHPAARTSLRLAYRSVVAAYRLARGDMQAALATFQAAARESDTANFVVLTAFYQGMTGVLTGNADMLFDAMERLKDNGDRRLTTTLLYWSGTIGTDDDVLEFAMDEARTSGDRLLQLQILHTVGGAQAQAEATQLINALRIHLPKRMHHRFDAHPAVRWTRRPYLHQESVPSDLSSSAEHISEFNPDFALLEET